MLCSRATVVHLPRFEVVGHLAKRKRKSGLNFVRHSLDDRDAGLAEVLADRFLSPILRWTTGSLLFELIGLSLCFIEFCSFL